MPAILDSLAFLDPLETITATNFSEVTHILEFAEMRARAGAYVLVMLSYEAAPAFDSALCTHKPDDFPLAWAGVFLEPSNSTDSIRSTVSPNPWLPKVTKDEYNECVARIRELIADGDTYQVNYSFPLTSSFTGDSLAWFHALRGSQHANYSAYVDLGRYKILSLSPELFFERHGDHVHTKPMKGTVQRGATAGEDEELARWLQNSIKNRAENVMIVDLLRNDLGKVSVPGGVQVTSLFDLERFETVWQMTSTVEATLKNGTSLVDLIAALFPCGSVTGAPKIRTMQIIRELERFPRGAYTGTIGLLRPGGDCTFNVAIRTVVLDTDTNLATCSVGGGITIDSTADDEYQECLVKSRFLYIGKDFPPGP